MRLPEIKKIISQYNITNCPKCKSPLDDTNSINNILMCRNSQCTLFFRIGDTTIAFGTYTAGELFEYVYYDFYYNTTHYCIEQIGGIPDFDISRSEVLDYIPETDFSSYEKIMEKFNFIKCFS